VSGAALPLFPLNTVLFPGGPLSLRIFEPRYLDMVRRCGREQSVFGVVLILAGAEVGEVTSVAGAGTTARLVDFTTRADGLLGIDCVGEQRFRLLRRWQQPDGLNWAEVEYLPAEPPCALPAAFEHLAQLLRELLPRLADAYARVPVRYEDAGWVGNRWAELLPLAAAQKQRLLELTDPIERLTQVAAWSGGQAATAYV